MRISVLTQGQSQARRQELLLLLIPQVLCNSVSLEKDKQTQEGQRLVSMQCGGSVIDISKEGILGTEIPIVLCCTPNPWHPQFKLSKTKINTLKDLYHDPGGPTAGCSTHQL